MSQPFAFKGFAQNLLSGEAFASIEAELESAVKDKDVDAEPPPPSSAAADACALVAARGYAPGELHKARQCYTCKARFHTLHHFYASLCPKCAALNYRMRHVSADLRGRVALLTGSRVKIGFEIGT